MSNHVYGINMKVNFTICDSKQKTGLFKTRKLNIYTNKDYYVVFMGSGFSSKYNRKSILKNVGVESSLTVFLGQLSPWER